MSSRTHLYEDDFVLWTEQQAGRLREAASSGTNLSLDWQNLAEEVESLGRSERRELRSRLTTILEHLFKLMSARAEMPRAGWRSTIRRTRVEVEGILQDNPSLRTEIPRLLHDLVPQAAKLGADDLIERGEAEESLYGQLARTSLTEEQVLGDWFPDRPNLA